MMSFWHPYERCFIGALCAVYSYKKGLILKARVALFLSIGARRLVSSTSKTEAKMQWQKTQPQKYSGKDTAAKENPP